LSRTAISTRKQLRRQRRLLIQKMATAGSAVKGSHQNIQMMVCKAPAAMEKLSRIFLHTPTKKYTINTVVIYKQPSKWQVAASMD